jgi:hypothetical protein
MIIPYQICWASHPIRATKTFFNFEKKNKLTTSAKFDEVFSAHLVAYQNKKKLQAVENRLRTKQSLIAENGRRLGYRFLLITKCKHLQGERKGQNHYYPPDFNPEKHKNLNRYHGTHALRERAAKISQGILIIRFEMPFNVWCLSCENHIGMGVRYNAEKKKVGMFHTTPVYEFRMQCHLCASWMTIKTDPEVR